jgi:hypothetical protein
MVHMLHFIGKLMKTIKEHFVLALVAMVTTSS